MARRLRLFVKKRGARRTDSPTLGGAALSLFFAIVFFGGVGFLTQILVTLIVPEWRVNQRFRETSGIVLKTQIGQSADNDSSYRPEILIRYQPQDTSLEKWTYDATWIYSTGIEEKRRVLERYVVGREYRCWYDPADPQTVVLVRGYTWLPWLTALVPASFVIVGGAGLAITIFNWGKSVERRAVDTGYSVPRELFDSTNGAPRDYPGLPGDATLTDSPGTTLAFRLPVRKSTTWSLMVALVVAVVVNGVVAVFAVMATRNHLRGEPDWFLTLFLIPWALIGLAALFYFVRQLILTSGVGPTTVEISAHPLYPGHSYDLFLSQSGNLSINRLAMTLVCEEKATYQQGTNTRTELKRVNELEIFSREKFSLRHGEPFEQRATLSVPQDAMHSFRANHNEICWRLIVHGDVAEWPDYERSFPVVVFPPQDPNGQS